MNGLGGADEISNGAVAPSAEDGLKHLMLYTDVETLYRCALAEPCQGGLLHTLVWSDPNCGSLGCVNSGSLNVQKSDTWHVCNWQWSRMKEVLMKLNDYALLQGRAGRVRAGGGVHGHLRIAAGPRRVHAAAPGRFP